MTRSEETLSTRDIASPAPAQEHTLRDGTDDVEATTTEPAGVEESAVERDDIGERDTAADRRSAADDIGERDTAADQRPAADDDGPLLPESQGQELQSRWEAIQVRFVDDPRNAVEEADALVASTMQQLADGFASAREDLEGQWSRGEDISTEDLRVALQRYRSFFRRLLAA
jgi:hypothetical protein